MTITLTPSSPRRVTIVTPHTRADLSLPTEATISELIPQLITLVGVQAEDPTGSSGGWVLSHLGGAPLHPDRSVNAAGIGDGDTLYLSPSSATMPPVIFDDVIDAIASSPASGPGRWAPRHTRMASLGAVTGLAGFGLLNIWLAGPTWTIPAIGAGLIALLGIGAGAGLSRARGDLGAGAVMASIAVVYAACAGALAPLGEGGLAELDQVSLLLACVGLLSAGALSVIAVGAYLPWFVSLTLLGTVGNLAWFAGLLLDLSTVQIAATLSGLLLAFSPSFPALALRIARLPFPHVPADVEEFGRDEPPTLDRDVLLQTGRADLFLLGLLATAMVWIGGCAAVLLIDGNIWAVVLVVLLGLVLPIRSRLMVGLYHRACLILAGSGLLVATLATVVLPQRGELLLALLAGTASAMAITMAYALIAPGRSPSPYWGRILDFVEFLAAAATLPVVAVILNLYLWIRGLGG